LAVTKAMTELGTPEMGRSALIDRPHGPVLDTDLEHGPMCCRTSCDKPRGEAG
jgi:hypothetical protein